MKTVTKLLIRFLALSLIATTLAHADFSIGPTKVSKVTLTNIPKKNGMAVTVFYAHATPPFSIFPGGIPDLGSFKMAPVTIPVSSDGTVVIPKKNVPRKNAAAPADSTYLGLNYLVVVLHSSNQEVTDLRNLDGKDPYKLDTGTKMSDVEKVVFIRLVPDDLYTIVNQFVSMTGDSLAKVTSQSQAVSIDFSKL